MTEEIQGWKVVAVKEASFVGRSLSRVVGMFDGLIDSDDPEGIPLHLQAEFRLWAESFDLVIEGEATRGGDPEFFEVRIPGAVLRRAFELAEGLRGA